LTTTDASLLLLAAALAYASLGWPVIPLHTPKDDGTCDCNRPKAKGPCENVGKHPRTRNGLDDATTDEDTIRRWWKMFPNANIGIALEGAQLVDIAPDGIPYWAEFHSRGMPETIRFSSGGGEGHEHSLYRRPEHCPAYRLTQSGDFDILSHGYCVAPPSRHKSGQLYRWLDPIESLPIAGPTAIAPEWAVAMLLEKARRPKGRVAHAQGADDDGPPIELEGEDLERWHGRMFDPREDGGVDRSYSLWSLAMLLLRRAQLRFTRITASRPRRRVSPTHLRRIDTAWAVGIGLSAVDPIRGAAFQSLNLLLSLRSGDPYRICRAIALEAIVDATADQPTPELGQSPVQLGALADPGHTVLDRDRVRTELLETGHRELRPGAEGEKLPPVDAAHPVPASACHRLRHAAVSFRKRFPCPVRWDYRSHEPETG
jgi:hypothetical protein